MNEELKLELEALSTADLEEVASVHFMYKSDCPPEIRSFVRRKQAVASEILVNRAGASSEV